MLSIFEIAACLSVPSMSGEESLKARVEGAAAVAGAGDGVGGASCVNAEEAGAGAGAAGV